MRDAWGGKTQPQERPGPLQSADRHEDPENQRACSIAHYIPDNLTPECSLGFFCFVLLFLKKKTKQKPEILLAFSLVPTSFLPGGFLGNSLLQCSEGALFNFFFGWYFMNILSITLNASPNLSLTGVLMIFVSST